MATISISSRRSTLDSLVCNVTIYFLFSVQIAGPVPVSVTPPEVNYFGEPSFSNCDPSTFTAQTENPNRHVEMPTPHFLVR